MTGKVISLKWWEQRESNPRPSACKADALNQLSYAPVSFLFADNCVRLRIFSRSLPQGNSLLQSLSSLFSTKINFNFLASFTRLLRWTSLGGRSLPKGNSLPSRSSALPSGKISGEIFRRTFLAVRTGLEPATPGVTGRYSNQLNYRTNCSDLCRILKMRVQK